METFFDMMCDTHCVPKVGFKGVLAVFFLSHLMIFICMEKLTKILIGLYEGVCERLPNESDEEFLTRCGNMGFADMDSLRMAQSFGTYHRNVVKENGNKKELELQKLKLMNQAFKMLPNSPKQLAVRREIERIDKILKGLKESNNTQPSTSMRDEPHPTRHETEHPPIEKTAFKRLDPFKEPTKK